MRDVVYLDQIEQAEALLKPQRLEVLRQLAEPRSCTEVAVELDLTPQRVYYHMKRLVEAGLVRQVAERRVRGIHEGIYQASGRSYWLSPGLVGRIGLRQTRDRLSLGYLVDLMEDVQADVAALDLTRPDLPSIGVSGDIRVRPEQRKAFLDELQRTLQDLFTRYGGAEGDAFRLAVACYPKGDPDDRTAATAEGPGPARGRSGPPQNRVRGADRPGRATCVAGRARRRAVARQVRVLGPLHAGRRRAAPARAARGRAHHPVRLDRGRSRDHSAVRAGRGRGRHAGHAEPERPAELPRRPGRHGRCPWSAATVLVPGDREPC